MSGSMVVEVPVKWVGLVHPRRGGLVVRAGVEPAAGAVARLERLVEETAAEVSALVEAATGPVTSFVYGVSGNATEQERKAAAREAMARAELQRELAQELAEVLRGGERTPLAAALVFTLVGTREPEVFADGWAAGHGMGFAAAAAMAVVGLAPGQLAPADPRWWRWDDVGVLRRVRALLAGASEEEYRAAVAAIAGVRERDSISRIVAAYLAPTEAEWVAEAMAEPSRHPNLSLLQCCSVGAAGAVMPKSHWLPPDEEILANLVDGLGERVVEVFGELPQQVRYDAKRWAKVLPLLAGVRTDAAFSLLLECLDVPAVLPFLQEAAAARPAECAALYASLPEARPLLRGLLMGHPEARTPALLRAAGLEPPVPEAGTARLPVVVADPPWGPSRAGGRGRRAADADWPGGDELRRLPSRLPKYGDWLRPAELPQLRLRADRSVAVPQAAQEHVVMCFALSKPGAVYPGVRELREACEPRSLAEFAWAIFEMWRLAGMPADGFALRALGWVGDDEVVRRLTPIIRAWPGQSGHQRAVVGLEVLAEIGTEVALTHLHGIALRLKYKGLKKRAEEKIAAVAARLGLSIEQLEDRVVPGFGLPSGGVRTIDYGGRVFTVGFDERLQPFVIDPKGKVRKSLPPPTGGDDADRATDARAWFAGLRKELKPVADAQVARLERAMLTQRTWSAAEFRAYLVEHPLLTHLVRRLLWTATEVPGGQVAFRVAEDLTLADVTDGVLELPDTAVVRLAHPALVDELEAWSGLFADYEILQPFEQLGRKVGRFSESELASSELTRFVGATASNGRLMALRHRGWETPDWYATRPLPGGLVMRIRLHPGITAMYFDASERQRFAEITLEGGVFGDLQPVAASELLADLEALTG